MLGVVIVGCVLWLIWAVWPSSDKPAVPETGYLDMHVHTAGLGHGDSGAFVGEELQENFRFPVYLQAFGVTEEELMLEGDQIVLQKISNQVAESEYVGQAVILAMDGIVDERGDLDIEATVFHVPNEFLMRELPKHDNLLFGASINPYRKDALERLERVADNGAVLIKWIPNIMDIDPSDQFITPFYQRMRKLGLPLLTHTGRERSFGHSSDRLSDPQLLRLPLSLGVTIIAAHIATTGETDGEPHFDRLQVLLDEYPNLYADISALTQYNRLNQLHEIMESGNHLDRLINGSDWPLQFFPVVSPWFHINHISTGDLKLISNLDNTWDRDIVLKKKLGVPDEIFERSRELLANPYGLASAKESKEEDEENDDEAHNVDNNVQH